MGGRRRWQDCIPIPNGDGTSRLPLTRGLFATIDTADEKLVSGMLWYAHPASRKGRSFFYAKGKAPGDSPLVYLHRLLLCFPILHCDHRDRDGLNNRRCNLRLVTHRENMLNVSSHGGSASKYKGVSPSGSDVNPWRAGIAVNDVYEHIGTFETEEDAAIAYNRRAVELHGELAVLNDVPDREPVRKKRSRKHVYRGVYKGHGGGFIAVVSREFNSKRFRKQVGTFPTAIDAAIAHDNYAVKVFGDRAITNASLGLLPTQEANA